MGRVAFSLILTEGGVRKWEYKKIVLSEAPRRGDDIDLLSDAGEEGWELVSVLPNGLAYLKREIDEMDTAEEPIGKVDRATPAREEVVAVREEVASGAQAKYRDPATGDTWSGRGRMANWLKRKVDAGEDVDKYLV
jgi:DNA-binding protein H-NS